MGPWVGLMTKEDVAEKWVYGGTYIGIQEADNIGADFPGQAYCTTAEVKGPEDHRGPFC